MIQVCLKMLQGHARDRGVAVVVAVVVVAAVVVGSVANIFLFKTSVDEALLPVAWIACHQGTEDCPRP